MKRLVIVLGLCVACALSSVQSYAAEVVEQQEPDGKSVVEICDTYINAMVVAAYLDEDAEVDRINKEMQAWLQTLPLSDQAIALNRLNEFNKSLGIDADVPNKEELEAKINDYLARYTQAYMSGDMVKAEAILEELDQWTTSLSPGEASYVTGKVSEMMNKMADVYADFTARPSLGKEAVKVKMDGFFARLITSPENADAINAELQTWIESLAAEDAAYAMQYFVETMEKMGLSGAMSDERKVEINNQLNAFVSRINVATINSDVQQVAQVQSELEAWLSTLSVAEMTYALEYMQKLLQQ